jgi:hypothetical protein
MPTDSSQLLAQIKDALGDPQLHELAQVSTSFYSANLGLLKAAAVLATAGLFAATIFFAVKTGWLAVRIDRVEDVILKSDLPKKRSIKAWETVKKHFFGGSDQDLKVALIEADNLLDEALKFAGFQGVSLGEKLKTLTEAELPNINGVWEAHKLRNRIVHEPGFKLNRDTAERALAIYEQTLKDLGVLD